MTRYHWRFASLAAMILRAKNCQSGVAMVELAYSLPLFMILGLTGTELSHLAVTNMQISQVTSSIADNLSRAKQTVALTLPQFREHDIRDAFIGSDLQANKLQLFQNGRVIISSLQRNTSNGQWIKWQRCRGARGTVSRYGAEGTGSTGTSFLGMGPATNRITAQPGGAVIFAEVTYTYKPLVAAPLLGPIVLRQEFAYDVRDDRDLTEVHNPIPKAAKRTCDIFTAA